MRRATVMRSTWRQGRIGRMGSVTCVSLSPSAPTRNSGSHTVCLYLEPREVTLSGDKNDKVVSFDTFDLIARKLQHHTAFRKRALAQSERLKTGDLYKTLPDGLISETIEGAEACYHPHLWRPATEEEADDVRIPLEFSCDDFEVPTLAQPRYRTHTR
jgi:hypothetical protein